MTIDDRPPHDYIPAPGPIGAAPWQGGYALPETRSGAFRAVLAGVDLGAYDSRIIAWLAGLDDPTCRTVASLIWRARLAAAAELAARLDGLRAMLAAVLADESRDPRLALGHAARELGQIAAGRPGTARTVTFDLTADDDLYFTLTEALGEWAARQRHEAGAEGGNPSRIRWAERAEAAAEAVEAALDGPAAGEEA